MDTTVPEIRFDVQGECQYCKMHEVMDRLYPLEPDLQQKNLSLLVNKIRASAKGGPYDCVLGVSGGRDSTWGLYNAVKSGLRPLAVHFDNGWNSAISVTNIQNATKKLNVDLETVVADWDEFRELQVSFLKASVPDVEIPTDVAIHGVLHQVAAKEGIQYVFFCHSFRTEGIVPRGWSFLDGRYIDSVQKKFGERPLRDFKNFKLWDFLRYSVMKGIQGKSLVNYFPYHQKEVDRVITKELGWTYYGGHHHESTYTRFIQSYLLPKKFNIDKRKTEFSALIRSGQITRAAALRQLETSYEYDETLIPYILSKLGLSVEQWDMIFNAPPKTFQDYSTYYPLLRSLKLPIKIATDFGLLPELLYLKYLG